jgi:hypothetical protein
MTGEKMRIRFDAVKYIDENGNIFDKLCLVDVLNQQPDKNLIEDLLSLQNPDEGFPWKLLGKIPSSIVMTSRVLELLFKIGFDKNSFEVKKGINFLVNKQRLDGGWSENPELAPYIPKEHGWISIEHSMTWATGEVVIALIKVGYPNHASIKNAVSFLKRTQKDDGGWNSHVGKNYPYGTDLASMDSIVRALLLSGEDRTSDIMKRVVSTLLKYRNKWESPVDASAVLDIFLNLGYDPKNEYVKELVQTLIRTQKPNGSWSPIETLATDPTQTLYCFQQLKKCGVQIYLASPSQ